MKKVLYLLAIATVSVVALSSFTKSKMPSSLMCELCGKDSKPLQLHRAMQKLWADHMIWTYVTVDALNQAIPVLTAAKNNEKAGLDKALAYWYANANDIADFLTAANPKNWPATATQPMKVHIDQTTTYAVDLLKNDYTNAVKKFDEAHQHMVEMGTILASGIIKQYPNKFEKAKEKIKG